MAGTYSTQRHATSTHVRQAINGVALGAAILLIGGCRQDMHNQPKFYPQRSTTLFPDGRSARPQVENTVARNQLHANSYFYTGLVNGKEGDGIPLPVNMELMERGQEKYNIYCTPCHSRVGNGAGMIVQRGYRPAGNFHTDRLRNAPLGHFYSVIANGYGAMPEYGTQIAAEDRWAIVAYIRALQLSQAAKPADVPAGQHPQDLHEIANQQGMPPGFADPWALPATAVYGTPNNQDNGIPGLGTNTPSTGSSAHGSAAATDTSGAHDSGTPAQTYHMPDSSWASQQQVTPH
jgi:mono/diheme cytochrome c family protein